MITPLTTVFLTDVKVVLPKCKRIQNKMRIDSMDGSIIDQADSGRFFYSRSEYEDTKEDSLESWMNDFPYKIPILESVNIKSGTKTYKFNEKYVGDLVDEVRHGFGKYFYGNGNVYEGQWEEGQKHGVGKLEYHKGGFYVGEWRAGLKSGQGKEVVNGEYIYTGTFKRDRFHGYGVLKHEIQGINEGMFKNGKFLKESEKAIKIED
ncbi:unnamed protein product [Moneuplotes crassus]|uniref:MORN repeat-containing protein n=1 Tax=Euplotes crassus TaxID=5936 RepID=A0AAD1XFE9_EUPCR|nr:unnamed protein product [Moneuplotes crassus]